MTFLKKLGSIILRGAEIAAGFEPIVAAAFPKAAPGAQVVSQDLTQLANIVVSVEAAGQAISAPGAQKLTMAAPLVAQALLQSSVLVGHQIADPVLFQKAASEIAGGMADLLNSLKADVQTENKVG